MQLLSRQWLYNNLAPLCKLVQQHSLTAPTSSSCCTSVLCTLQDRQRGAADKKRRLQEANESGQMIVVDLDFDDMMREPEVHTVCHAVMTDCDNLHCHSRKANLPCRCGVCASNWHTAIL